MIVKKKIVINEEMQAEAVEMYEEKIKRLELKKEKILPEFNEKLTFLQQVQKDFAHIESLMKDYEDEIATCKRRIDYFMGKDSKQIIGVAGENKPKQIQWFPYINEIIKKENRFMIFDEIWAELAKNEELVALAIKNVKGFNGMKMPVKNSLEAHALNVTSERKRFCSKYQDKYGLPEWVNLKGKLTDAKRAAEFIGIEESPVVIPITSPKSTKRKVK